MAGSPLIALGTLNRLVASVTWQSFPQLNVTPSYLNREAIRLALDGESTRFLPTIAGAVTSPEPYMMVTLTINLLKTQQLSALYKAQMESSTLLGNGVVRPDVAPGSTAIGATGGGISPYDIVNCAIEGVREQSYSGEDAGWVVVCRGYYLVNSQLWL
jgi:hypothetical protein